MPPQKNKRPLTALKRPLGGVKWLSSLLMPHDLCRLRLMISLGKTQRGGGAFLKCRALQPGPSSPYFQNAPPWGPTLNSRLQGRGKQDQYRSYIFFCQKFLCYQPFCYQRDFSRKQYSKIFEIEVILEGFNPQQCEKYI